MAQRILRWFGIVYVVVGVCGFFFHDGAGNEFGFLNVNPLHDAIHAAVGALSIALSFNVTLTRLWGWFGLVLFGLLVVYGVWPQLNLLASAVPIPLTGGVWYFHILSFIAIVSIVSAARPQEIIVA
jgi:hypothetical protein